MAFIHMRPSRKQRRRPWNPKPFVLDDQATPAGALHGCMAGRPMIVVGNAYSLNYQDREKITHFKTLGCNRCLRPDFIMPAPDYYTCVDRDPYQQEVERIRAFDGIRVLAESLFDPNVISKKTPVRPKPAHQQPLPDFPWYNYRAVSCWGRARHDRKIYTRWPEHNRGSERGWIDIPQWHLNNLVPNGANIATLMLQLALGFGANPIGIAGVDLSWESKKKSHAFADGEGQKLGAFQQRSNYILPFFESIAKGAYEHGVKVYNLSPRGMLSPLFDRISETEFHKRFGEYADGASLCPGELLELRTPPTGRARFNRANLGGQQDPAKVRRKKRPDRGPSFPDGRAHTRKRAEARKALATRKSLAAKRKARKK